MWQLFRRFAPYLRGCAGLVALTVLLVLAAPFLGGAMLWLLKLVVDEVLVAGRIELLYPYAGLYGTRRGPGRRCSTTRRRGSRPRWSSG